MERPSVEVREPLAVAATQAARAAEQNQTRASMVVAGQAAVMLALNRRA